MSTEEVISSPPKSRRWLQLLLVLLAGVVVGVALDRFVLTDVSGPSDRKKNPNVTKDNYVKIQPEMTSWEVNDILGSGEIIAEQGYIVDAAGRFKKYSRDGNRYDEQTGTVSGHEGKPSQEIKQEVVWRNGDMSIYVTFLNSKAVSKKENGLYN